MNLKFLLLVALMGCFTSGMLTEVARAQTGEEDPTPEYVIKPIRYTDLADTLRRERDGLTVVNFWATWCRPCVAELPYFERLNKEYADRGVEVWLVSLDEEDLIGQVRSFAAKKGLESELFMLTNKDPNTFVGEIDDNWSGSLPATLLVGETGDYLKFHEGSVTYRELETFIRPYLD